MSGPEDALRYFAPSAALSRYVTVIFAWTRAPTSYAEWMPAIDAQIVVRLAGSGSFEFVDGSIVAPAPAAVIGALSGTTRLRVGAGFESIGVGLTAAGWRTLIGVAAHEMTDRAADLADLWGDQQTANLLQLLLHATSLSDRVSTLEAVLLARCEPRRSSWREHAVDHWIANSSLSIDSLGAMLGLSHRQAARIALSSNGLSPKVLAMKHRALRAAMQMVASGGVNWLNYGYADQSHMIRDFKRFIGVTPKRFSDVELSRHVFEAPERAGAHLARIKD